MLDNLETIAWSELKHAYGKAGDVPGMIRSLGSPDEHVRRDALGALFETICHQGTVYEASPFAVPFLQDRQHLALAHVLKQMAGIYLVNGFVLVIQVPHIHDHVGSFVVQVDIDVAGNANLSAAEVQAMQSYRLMDILIREKPLIRYIDAVYGSCDQHTIALLVTILTESIKILLASFSF